MNEAIQCPTDNAAIERVEKICLDLPQIDCPLVHRFAPGVYLREIFMPAGPDGTFVIGQEHKTEHFNIVLKGRVSVWMGDHWEVIVGPCTFASKAGVRKVLFVHEDTIWQTVHPTTETDMVKLDEMLITKSATFSEHQIMEAVKHLRLEEKPKTLDKEAAAA